MNAITKLVTQLNEWLEPVRDFATDDVFRGEMLATVGAKEKDNPADKAKTKEKLTGLLKKLDDLRNWLGLTESNVPKVDNLIALALLLQESKLIYDALRTVLESCDFGEGDADAKETKIANAVGSISKILTLVLFKKNFPVVAAFAESAGIFSDEVNESRRALYLISTADVLRPTGDPGTDLRQRISKAIYLDSAVMLVLLPKIFKSFYEKHGEEMGEFLLSFGWEVPPELDQFPHANRVASRVLQLQYIPGTFLRDNGQVDDVLISFATVPVMPPGIITGTEQPVGFQYILKFESMLDNVWPGGDNFGGIKFALPAKRNISLIWGHQTEFNHFSGDSFGLLPLLEMLLPAPKNLSDANEAGTRDGTPASEETLNGFRRGEIELVINPKNINIRGADLQDLDFRLDFRDFKLVISGDGRDGFIQKILPTGNLTINANVAVGYSVQNGFYTEGFDDKDGLFFQLAIGKVFGKTLEIPRLYVGLRPSLGKDTNGQDKLQGIALESSAQINVKLGPFQMTVDQLGIGLTLDFSPNGRGNLGGAQLDVGLKSPTGIGFVVKGNPMQGGGFLSFDSQKGQYVGAAQLTTTIKNFFGKDRKLSLNAIGVVLTKRPDGSKGFSFLLMASAEFSPALDFFMGTKLRAVGVLVSMDRTIDLDAFRDGIRDNRFDSVLFPENPVGNAPAIVSQMTTLFPLAEGHYAFAVMAWLEWGSSKLVDLKLGILIDIFNTSARDDFRVSKMAIVGVLRVSVEKGDLKIARFVMNFLVALDLDKSTLSVDAALYDSKFVQFDVKGEFYLRVKWGSEPFFLLSVGGWHPDFIPPPVLQLPAKPQRIALPLLNNSAVKLNLSFYVALTSNSFQFGSVLELKVKVSKFRLEAGLSLDALFRSLNEFLVDFEGKLLIFWGDRRLAGITVKGVFSGTTPWRIRGSATFSIWIWDYDVDFDHSSGPETTRITQSIDVLPALETALRDARNWRVTLPDSRTTHTILRPTDDEPGTAADKPFRADPLARIEVVQQVVPLGVRIDKIGYERARDFRQFDLRPADATTNDATVEDFFAPGMFLDLNDAEKLSRKSYESMPAGRSFGDFGVVKAGVAYTDEFDFEDSFFDTLPPPPTQTRPVIGLSAMSPERFQQLLANGSVARSERGQAVLEQREIRTRQVSLGREAFVLVDGATGKPIDGVAAQHSMTAAYTEQWNQSKQNPLRQTNVVRRFENL